MNIFILLTDRTEIESRQITRIRSMCEELYRASNFLHSITYDLESHTADLNCKYISSDFMSSVNDVIKSDVLITSTTFTVHAESAAGVMSHIASFYKKLIITDVELSQTLETLKAFRVNNTSLNEE